MFPPGFIECERQKLRSGKNLYVFFLIKRKEIEIFEKAQNYL
jgi:hypothetical protein